MKLHFEDDCKRYQPDPFIFEVGGRYYMYVTAHNGVEAYPDLSVYQENRLRYLRSCIHSEKGKD